VELYEDFMARRKHNHLQSFTEKERNKTKDVVITIPLKGGQGQRKELDEDFIKVIQNEYAIRYLESLGLAATQANIDHVLEKAPLSSCEFASSWSNSGWLADCIVIYPNNAKKRSGDIQAFDKCRDQISEQQKKL